MTDKQKRVSNALTEDGFPPVAPAVGGVLHDAGEGVLALVDNGGVISLVRPTSRGMVPIEANQVPRKFFRRIMLGRE